MSQGSGSLPTTGSRANGMEMSAAATRSHCVCPPLYLYFYTTPHPTPLPHPLSLSLSLSCTRYINDKFSCPLRIQEERAERHRIKNMYQTRESGKSSRFEAPEPKIPGFLGMGKCVSLSSVLKGTHGSFCLFYSELRQWGTYEIGPPPDVSRHL